jgi:hypothetical protein
MSTRLKEARAGAGESFILKNTRLEEGREGRSTLSEGDKGEQMST